MTIKTITILFLGVALCAVAIGWVVGCACDGDDDDDDDDLGPATCEQLCAQAADCEPSCVPDDCATYCQEQLSLADLECAALSACENFNACLCAGGGDDDDDDATDDDDDDDTTDGALLFDGETGFAYTLGTLYPSTGKQFTVEGWAWLDPTSTAIDSECLISNREQAKAEGGGFHVHYSNSKEQLRFSYWYTVGAGKLVSSSDPVPKGQWFHFAATYFTDYFNSKSCLYMNGKLQNCLDSIEIILESKGALYLGRSASIYPHLIDPFNGGLNEVRISSIVRYTTDFIVPSEPFEPDGDTIALYHFNEGAGDTSADSNYHNHLTLVGGVSWTDFTY